MNYLKDYALVIFDCDGVLVDSESIANKILAQSLTQEGYMCSFQEAVTKFVGRDLNSIQREVEKELGRPLDPNFQTKLQQKTTHSFKKELKPIEGIKTALKAIRTLKCVASSGSQQKIRLSLTLTNLSDFFLPETIFSASEVHNGKPAPDLFLHAAAKMGVSPSRSIVIEDSVPGVTAAHAAGMPVFGFAGGQHVRPTHSENLSKAGAIVFKCMASLPRHLQDVDPLRMRGTVLYS
ncbi:MAG: hydrolase [Rhodospirillaceae bacterium]|nr:hydrolase [Rhodospirillaceae bacterium]|tara:strand:- start:852 stop:1559 length:708 start_codon:yes stop_codon:yes gene_type:complete